MSTAAGAHDDEFLEVADQAVAASGTSGALDATGALDALGWWDMLADLDDIDARTAVFAVFRAQGRHTSESPALAGLLAEPYRHLLGGAAGALAATINRLSARGLTSDVLVGTPTNRNIVIDRPSTGASLYAASDVRLRRLEMPGRLDLYEVDSTDAQPLLVIGDGRAESARERSNHLGRLAIAAEILGASEAIVASAIEYAGQREQFGKQIGQFQAMRHLLAWAHTDCVAIDRVLRPAITLDRDAPAMYGQIVKALAGRNGRRACERSLQVFGGIGFTAEHHHMHHHGRVLALDSLLGASSTLTSQLGTWLRTDPVGPTFAAELVRLATP